MTEAKEKAIFWIDAETNGTTPHNGDVLLEVAMLATDTNLNILDEEGYHAVIRYTAEEVEKIKKKTVPFVLDMHTKTALWDKLPHGTERNVVDDELLAYMKKFEERPRLAPIGGNSITLDRNFLEKYLPLSFGHMGYRSIDASTVAKLINYWMGSDYFFEKKKSHEAMGDIRESIAELKYLRKIGFVPEAQ